MSLCPYETRKIAFAGILTRNSCTKCLLKTASSFRYNPNELITLSIKRGDIKG